MLTASTSWGQIAAWDFFGESSPATSAADVYNSNLDASNLVTRGPGAPASTASNSFRTTGFQNNGISTSNTDYFQFTLSASTGYTLSLSTLNARFAGTATFRASPGGVSAQFAYSLDGSTFTLIGSPFVMTTDGAMPQISLSGITALQNISASTTVTFRYYASGQTATGGWGFNSPALGQYGLSIGGTVAAATISSDATLSNLVLSSGTLNPAFASATTTYTASVANSVSSITVTPTANEANATITVNGVPVTSGSASGAIALSEGSNNTITTVVTAQDGTTTKTYTVTVTRAAAAAAVLTLTSPLADFGNVCINTTAVRSFSLSGNNLNGDSISIAALPRFTYSETENGAYTSTLRFGYTGNMFTDTVIYVKFSPTAVQSYNGNITLNGGGVSDYTIPATGSGVNTTPTVTTESASAIAATSATISATINSSGCTTITNYGFFYSTNSGFPNGEGTRVIASNLSGGTYSTNLTGLTPNMRYYYKAYVTNGTDTVYGAQQAFNANPLPVTMASQPDLTFTEDFHDIANWSNFFITGEGANHWDGLSATATAPATGIPNPTILTASTSSFQAPFGNPPGPSSSGGVHKGTDQSPPTQSIVLLSTGGTDNTSSAAIDFYMDFTSVNAGTLSFDWASVNNQTGDRKGSMRIYGSVNGTTFTEIPSAAVLNFTNNAPTNGSITNIALPAFFNNNPNAILRFYYYNATGGTTGSRPKLSIDNLTVTAVPSTPCSTPTAQPTSMVFGTKTDVSIQGSFTAASPASDQYLTIVSNNSTLTSNPIDGVTYNVGESLGDGTVVARGSSLNFTATGLSPSTTYYFFTFAFNGVCTGGPNYLVTNPLTNSTSTNAAFPPCTAPASQANQLVFSNATTSSIQGSFTATTADEYLVLRSTSSTLTANPVNGQTYNNGDVLGNATVVQRNNTTSFIASGLAPGTTYYFFIFSSNSQSCVNGPAYNTNSPLEGSQATMPLPPCVTPSSQPALLTFTTGNTSISGAFNASNTADNYLVIRSTSSTLSATPADNANYSVGTSLGGGIVIANSGSLSFLTNNLAPATTYYFFVFAANKNCSNGPKYLTTSPLIGNTTTTTAPLNNFYFGSLHSHSDYSDGNKDRPGYTPAQDYEYAKTAECMDFLGISEHNHFSSPDNPGNLVSTYHQGTIQANNFNASNPNFVALYGMEWGVISGGGHVVVYGDGMDDLFGWESGSGPWGSSNNYDVYVPKSVYTGPTGLFKTVNDYASKNTFATLAHPNQNDYNNLANIAYDNVADMAITGTAVESGPANSTNTTYSNPGSPLSYLWYYQTMLSKGYHLGPTIDHDNHNTTFGKTTYSRTAVVAPSLTKSEIIKAMRDMHFYATEDCDSKVDFTINTNMMGSVVTGRNAPTISVVLTDATTSTSSAIIRLMSGTPGSGTMPVKIDSVIGNTLYFIDENLAINATGYYYVDITNGSSRIVTSPIWYTRTAIPALSINDVTTTEGNTGTKIYSYTVTLSSAAPAGGVTFDIATADNTATNASGDYVSKSLTAQTIPAGTSTYIFDVTVNGDAIVEGDETFFVNITNITGASASDAQGIGTILEDDNQAPTNITLSNNSIAENRSANSFVGKLTTSDPDAGQAFTYTLVPGLGADDNGSFTISADSLYTAASFDFETKNSYTILVRATDNGSPSQFFEKQFTIAVTNVNEAPVITSSGGGTNANENVPENTTAVVTVVATDQDAGSIVTYSISGGIDQNKFTINTTTGALSFITAPDFEAPTDFGADNIYVVTVRSSDGTLTDEQTIAVSIRNANDNAPVITSDGGGATASRSIPENTMAVTTVTATDADANTTMSYSIKGGSDAAKFSIDASTGALRFITAPDFEAPTDADANNTYIVTVRASDGTNTDDQTITVTIANVNDSPLPANLVNVKAYQKGSAIQVEWTSATEINVDKYEVEKSTDGQSFTPIGTVQARGNSTSHVNYSLADHQAQTGTNYYRIKSIDKNGTVQYSSVVRVNVEKGSGAITIYPHPVMNNTITLQLSNLERGKYTVTLTNKLGQQLYSSVIEHNGGSSTQTLRITGSFPKGTYQLQVISGDVSMTKQLIKN